MCTLSCFRTLWSLTLNPWPWPWTCDIEFDLVLPPAVSKVFWLQSPNLACTLSLMHLCALLWSSDLGAVAFYYHTVRLMPTGLVVVATISSQYCLIFIWQSLEKVQASWKINSIDKPTFHDVTLHDMTWKDMITEQNTKHIALCDIHLSWE